MTKPEFMRRKDEAHRNGKRFGAIYLPLFFLILIANVFVVKLVPHRYSWLYLIVFFFLLIANVFVMRWIERRRVDKFDLRCPNCKKPLIGSLAQVAIATGNCGNCGAHLFSG